MTSRPFAFVPDSDPGSTRFAVGVLLRAAVPLLGVLTLIDVIHAIAIRPAVLDPVDTIAAAGLGFMVLATGLCGLLLVEIVAFTLFGFIDRWFRRWRFADAVIPILAALAASPLLWLLGRQPFVGNRYRDSQLAIVGPWLVFGALFLVVVVGSWLALRGLRLWFAEGSSRRTSWIGMLICVLMLLPLMLIDVLWYVGWYPLIHTVLSLTVVVLLQAIVARHYLARQVKVWRHVAVLLIGVTAACVCVARWHPIQAWRVSTGTLISSRIVTPLLALTAPVDTLALLAEVPAVDLQTVLHTSQVLTVPAPLASDALLVTVDTLRSDAVSFRGDDRTLTPAIDEFFRDGVVFERAYAQYAATRHSVRALLQSNYQDRKDVQSPDLIRRLRHFGFSVVAVLPSDMKMFVNVERYNFTRVAFYDDERAVPDLTRELLATVPEEKRVVWVHLYQPHDPYTAPPEFVRDSGSRGHYDAEVRWVDADFARLLALFRKTPDLVVLGADHGEEFREHGGTLHGRTTYEETIHVPLAMKLRGWPAHRTAEPVANVDLAPTLLSALGIPIPDSYEGYDLLRRASRAPEERVIYSESVTNAITAVSGTKKWTYWSDLGLWEMYDIAKDPRELRNLADDAGQMVRGRELIAAYRLTGQALAHLRDVPSDQFSDWFDTFIPKLETQPELARWVAYQLASRFSANARIGRQIAEAARREKQPALAALLPSVRHEDAAQVAGGHQPVMPANRTSSFEIGASAPTLADRAASHEALAAQDPSRAIELLENTPPPPVETAALLRGLARTTDRRTAPVFARFVDNEQADIRAAAITGWCHAGGPDAHRALAARTSRERSPDNLQRLIECLLQYDRPLGVATLREEIQHRMLSDQVRAELIRRFAVADGADHLVELFLGSQSGSFKEDLFHALSQLPLSTEVFNRLAGTMRDQATEPRLRAHLDADLRLPRSKAPCNKYGKSPEPRELACGESSFGCAEQRSH